MQSYIIVFFQFLFAIYIIVSNYENALAPLPLFLILLSLIPGAAGMFTMKFRFNILPEPRENSQLITHGIYKYIRHPMYTSVLLSTLVITLSNPSLHILMIWFFLFATLLIKINREEILLTKKFPGYFEYRKKTKKLVPFKY